MAKSVAVTFCKENAFKRKLGEMSGVGLGGGDLDRLGMWAAQYEDVQVTRHQLVDLLSDQERARTLKQLAREGVAVGYPEVALVKNALPSLVPHQPHVLNRIAEEVFAMKFDGKEGSKGKTKPAKGYFRGRIGDKAAFEDLKKASGPSIPWREAPLLDEVRQKFREAWGDKFSVPVADINLYQGPEGGMAFHGDDERNVVICLNVGKEGETRDLDFQAFEEGLPVGERLSITLEHGDIYVLSEKAVGMDWRCKTKITWRHAAGHKDTYRPDNEVLHKEQEKLSEKSGKVARKRDVTAHLKNIAADIDIGYNKLSRKETFDVIENSHQVALLGVLERMDQEEVNEKDATGFTKLHWACNSDNHLVVAALLKIPHIEVNARNNFGYTPLMLAAAGCCVHSLKLLLEDPRVELNVANSDGVPLDKLIGSLCYSCSCSKEFKKKQTLLLQMIISEEKEARVGASKKGLRDVIKGVLNKDKKRKINALSDDSDDENDSRKKRKAEGDLGLSMSDDSGDEEKSSSKTKDDTGVEKEDSENSSSKDKDKSPKSAKKEKEDIGDKKEHETKEVKEESKEVKEEGDDPLSAESLEKKKIDAEKLEAEKAVDLESIMSGMNQTIKNKILVTKVKVSGLRVRQTTVSSTQLDDAIGTRKFIPMSDLGQFCKSVDTDWYTIAVLIKTGQKKLESGQAYTVWRMTDLKGKLKTLSVLLVGRAHKKHFNVSIKKVICLLNAKLMKGGEYLQVEHPDMAIDLGDSVDLGECGYKRESPVTCGLMTNRSVSQFCPLHDKKRYDELEQRRQLEASEKASEELRRQKNKAKDKGSEKNAALAVLAVKNKKMIQKQDPNKFFKKKSDFESREKIRKKVALSLGDGEGEKKDVKKYDALRILDEDVMMF